MIAKKKQVSSLKRQKATESKSGELAFGRQNYILLIIGVVVIILGFVLMIGGGSDDPTVFNDKIFSVRRITIAPILIIIGYIIEIFAIMKKPKN
ncbi:MAG: DUF3098 domain-containing protein [Bacteroidales bacterium]|nr:DUF3098 domain-containing protein [Bacteroidales bacterium]